MGLVLCSFDGSGVREEAERNLKPTGEMQAQESTWQRNIAHWKQQNLLSDLDFCSSGFTSLYCYIIYSRDKNTAVMFSLMYYMGGVFKNHC